jgi:hypothetical protein
MFGVCAGLGKRSRDAALGPSERLRDFDMLSAFPNRLSEAMLIVSDEASWSLPFRARRGSDARRAGHFVRKKFLLPGKMKNIVSTNENG